VGVGVGVLLAFKKPAVSSMTSWTQPWKPSRLNETVHLMLYLVQPLDRLKWFIWRQPRIFIIAIGSCNNENQH